jgi:hypothetical protein
MEKMSELDLQGESIKAAEHYIKKTQQSGFGVVEVSRIMTAFSHGFFCGWRKLEEKLINEEKAKKENVDNSTGV